MQTTVNVWLSNPAELVTLDTRDPVALANRCSLMQSAYDYSSCGWLKLGTAEVKFSMTFDEATATRAAIETLEKKIQEINAEAYEKTQTLRQGINNLLAISYTPDAKESVQEAKEPVYTWQDVIQSEGWTCIKTGCAMVIDGKAYWGDLFSNLHGERLFNDCAEVPQTSDYAWDSAVCTSVNPDSESLTTSYAGFPRLTVFAVADCKDSQDLSDYLTAMPGSTAA